MAVQCVPCFHILWRTHSLRRRHRERSRATGASAARLGHPTMVSPHHLLQREQFEQRMWLWCLCYTLWEARGSPLSLSLAHSTMTLRVCVCHLAAPSCPMHARQSANAAPSHAKSMSHAPLHPAPPSAAPSTANHTHPLRGGALTQVPCVLQVPRGFHQRCASTCHSDGAAGPKGCSVELGSVL